MTHARGQPTDMSLTEVDGRHRLVLDRRLAHPVERVWSAVTEADQLSRWFPARVRLELRIGAPVHFAMDQDEFAADGVVREVDPPRLLAFTWGADELRIELVPDGDGCHLRFSHTFGDHAGAASFASGWDACLNGLDEVLAGREPSGPGPSGEAHEQTVRELGLRVGSVEQTGSGWQARVERQLVRPAELVRPLLPVGPRAGDARWHLTEGTGHGARLVVTRDGLPDQAAADGERERLHDLVERLAAEVSATSP